MRWKTIKNSEKLKKTEILFYCNFSSQTFNENVNRNLGNFFFQKTLHKRVSFSQPKNIAQVKSTYWYLYDLQKKPFQFSSITNYISVLLLLLLLLLVLVLLLLDIYAAVAVVAAVQFAFLFWVFEIFLETTAKVFVVRPRLKKIQIIVMTRARIKHLLT